MGQCQLKSALAQPVPLKPHSRLRRQLLVLQEHKADEVAIADARAFLGAEPGMLASMASSTASHADWRHLTGTLAPGRGWRLDNSDAGTVGAAVKLSDLGPSSGTSSEWCTEERAAAVHARVAAARAGSGAGNGEGAGASGGDGAPTRARDIHRGGAPRRVDSDSSAASVGIDAGWWRSLRACAALAQLLSPVLLREYPAAHKKLVHSATYTVPSHEDLENGLPDISPLQYAAMARTAVLRVAAQLAVIGAQCREGEDAQPRARSRRPGPRSADEHASTAVEETKQAPTGATELVSTGRNASSKESKRRDNNIDPVRGGAADGAAASGSGGGDDDDASAEHDDDMSDPFVAMTPGEAATATSLALLLAVCNARLDSPKLMGNPGGAYASTVHSHRHARVKLFQRRWEEPGAPITEETDDGVDVCLFQDDWSPWFYRSGGEPPLAVAGPLLVHAAVAGNADLAQALLEEGAHLLVPHPVLGPPLHAVISSALTEDAADRVIAAIAQLAAPTDLRKAVEQAWGATHGLIDACLTWRHGDTVKATAKRKPDAREAHKVASMAGTVHIRQLASSPVSHDLAGPWPLFPPVTALSRVWQVCVDLELSRAQENRARAIKATQKPMSFSSAPPKTARELAYDISAPQLDPGPVLVVAARRGHEEAVKFLIALPAFGPPQLGSHARHVDGSPGKPRASTSARAAVVDAFAAAADARCFGSMLALLEGARPAEKAKLAALTVGAAPAALLDNGRDYSVLGRGVTREPTLRNNDLRLAPVGARHDVVVTGAQRIVDVSTEPHVRRAKVVSGPMYAVTGMDKAEYTALARVIAQGEEPVPWDYSGSALASRAGFLGKHLVKQDVARKQQRSRPVSLLQVVLAHRSFDVRDAASATAKSAAKAAAEELARGKHVASPGNAGKGKRAADEALVHGMWESLAVPASKRRMDAAEAFAQGVASQLHFVRGAPVRLSTADVMVAASRLCYKFLSEAVAAGSVTPRAAAAGLAAVLCVRDWRGGRLAAKIVRLLCSVGPVVASTRDSDARGAAGAVDALRTPEQQKQRARRNKVADGIAWLAALPRDWCLYARRVADDVGCASPLPDDGDVKARGSTGGEPHSLLSLALAYGSWVDGCARAVLDEALEYIEVVASEAAVAPSTPSPGGVFAAAVASRRLIRRQASLRAQIGGGGDASASPRTESPAEARAQRRAVTTSRIIARQTAVRHLFAQQAVRGLCERGAAYDSFSAMSSDAAEAYDPGFNDACVAVARLPWLPEVFAADPGLIMAAASGRLTVLLSVVRQRISIAMPTRATASVAEVRSDHKAAAAAGAGAERPSSGGGDAESKDSAAAEGVPGADEGHGDERQAAARSPGRSSPPATASAKQLVVPAAAAALLSRGECAALSATPARTRWRVHPDTLTRMGAEDAALCSGPQLVQWVVESHGVPQPGGRAIHDSKIKRSPSVYAQTLVAATSAVMELLNVPGITAEEVRGAVGALAARFNACAAAHSAAVADAVADVDSDDEAAMSTARGLVKVDPDFNAAKKRVRAALTEGMTKVATVARGGITSDLPFVSRLPELLPLATVSEWDVNARYSAGGVAPILAAVRRAAKLRWDLKAPEDESEQLVYAIVAVPGVDAGIDITPDSSLVGLLKTTHLNYTPKHYWNRDPTRTALERAGALGDIDKPSDIIAAPVSPAAAALNAAIVEGNLAKVRSLVAGLTREQLCGSEGEPPLLVAVRARNYDIVCELLMMPNIDAHARPTRSRLESRQVASLDSAFEMASCAANRGPRATATGDGTADVDERIFRAFLVVARSRAREAAVAAAAAAAAATTESSSGPGHEAPTKKLAPTVSFLERRLHRSHRDDHDDDAPSKLAIADDLSDVPDASVLHDDTAKGWFAQAQPVPSGTYVCAHGNGVTDVLTFDELGRVLGATVVASRRAGADAGSEGGTNSASPMAVPDSIAKRSPANLDAVKEAYSTLAHVDSRATLFIGDCRMYDLVPWVRMPTPKYFKVRGGAASIERMLKAADDVSRKKSLRLTLQHVTYGYDTVPVPFGTSVRFMVGPQRKSAPPAVTLLTGDEHGDPTHEFRQEFRGDWGARLRELQGRRELWV